jgi:hypothetical protein
MFLLGHDFHPAQGPLSSEGPALKLTTISRSVLKLLQVFVSCMEYILGLNVSGATCVSEVAHSSSASDHDHINSRCCAKLIRTFHPGVAVSLCETVDKKGEYEYVYVCSI